MAATGYRVMFTESGIFAETLTGRYTQLGRAQSRLDEMVGVFRRTRLPEPDGWYYISGPDGARDVVGMGRMRGNAIPNFKRDA